MGLVGTSLTVFVQSHFRDPFRMDEISGNVAEDMPSLCGAELSLAGATNALKVGTIDSFSGKILKKID